MKPSLWRWSTALAESLPEEFVYLEAEDILGLYAVLFRFTLEQAGGQVRERTLLESAVTRPRQYAYYQGADLAMQAAVLAQAVAEGQPFVDGNKRTAAVALTAFLKANGYGLAANPEERAEWILGLSAGLAPDELAGRIRPRLFPVSEV